MAKKAKRQIKKSRTPEIQENVLPQNILPMGERVEENKNIYISQSVYKQIHKFTKNKTTDESGGVLVGTVIEEFGKSNIVISGFVEAKFCEATPTTLKFTHETWEYVHSEIEKKHKGKRILGWIHTHPDFGIFLSEYDKFIHQNFFSEENQVAYVVDPIQKIEGFYFWINGNIEKCKGFYIYDKTGTQITVDSGEDEEDEEKREPLFSFKNVLIAVLSVIVVCLVITNISAGKKLDSLEAEFRRYITEQQIYSMYESQSIAQSQQEIAALKTELQELKDLLAEQGLTVEPAVPETPETPETPDDGAVDSGDGTADTGDGTGDTGDGTQDETPPSADEATGDDTTAAQNGGSANE